MIEFFAEIVVKCEVKPDKEIFKDIQDEQLSRWVSETTQKKSLQKYLKSGICWKGNAYYPASLCFTGWSCPSIFFIQTDTDYLVAEFTVLEHLCSTSLYHINFKKNSHISRKWKNDWGAAKCLVRMQS